MFAGMDSGNSSDTEDPPVDSRLSDDCISALPMDDDDANGEFEAPTLERRDSPSYVRPQRRSLLDILLQPANLPTHTTSAPADTRFTDPLGHRLVEGHSEWKEDESIPVQSLSTSSVPSSAASSSEAKLTAADTPADTPACMSINSDDEVSKQQKEMPKAVMFWNNTFGARDQCSLASRHGWLTDECINILGGLFWRQAMERAIQKRRDTPSMVWLSSFFFTKLAKMGGDSDHSHLQRFFNAAVREQLIFTQLVRDGAVSAAQLQRAASTQERHYQFEEFADVLIPVHWEGNHWLLAVYHSSKRTVTIYDSLRQPSEEAYHPISKAVDAFIAWQRHICTSTSIAGSLQQRQLSSFSSSTTLLRVDVAYPQQNNSNDCGIYMLSMANALWQGQTHIAAAASTSTIDLNPAKAQQLRKLWTDYLTHPHLFPLLHHAQHYNIANTTTAASHLQLASEDARATKKQRIDLAAAAPVVSHTGDVDAGMTDAAAASASPSSVSANIQSMAASWNVGVGANMPFPGCMHASMGSSNLTRAAVSVHPCHTAQPVQMQMASVRRSPTTLGRAVLHSRPAAVSALPPVSEPSSQPANKKRKSGSSVRGASPSTSGSNACGASSTNRGRKVASAVVAATAEPAIIVPDSEAVLSPLQRSTLHERRLLALLNREIRDVTRFTQVEKLEDLRHSSARSGDCTLNEQLPYFTTSYRCTCCGWMNGVPNVKYRVVQGLAPHHIMLDASSQGAPDGRWLIERPDRVLGKFPFDVPAECVFTSNYINSLEALSDEEQQLASNKGFYYLRCLTCPENSCRPVIFQLSSEQARPGIDSDIVHARGWHNEVHPTITTTCSQCVASSTANSAQLGRTIARASSDAGTPASASTNARAACVSRSCPPSWTRECRIGGPRTTPGMDQLKLKVVLPSSVTAAVASTYPSMCSGLHWQSSHTDKDELILLLPPMIKNTRKKNSMRSNDHILEAFKTHLENSCPAAAALKIAKGPAIAISSMLQRGDGQKLDLACNCSDKDDGCPACSGSIDPCTADQRARVAFQQQLDGKHASAVFSYRDSPQHLFCHTSAFTAQSPNHVGVHGNARDSSFQEQLGLWARQTLPQGNTKRRNRRNRRQRFLSLSNCDNVLTSPLTDEDVKQCLMPLLKDPLVSITELDLSWNMITDIGCEALAVALGKQCRRSYSVYGGLDLCNNPIGDPGVSALTTMIKQRGFGFHRLAIGGTCVKDNSSPVQITSAVICGLLDVLGDDHLVGLSDLRLLDIPLAGCSMFFNLLAKCAFFSNLRRLQLQRIGLTDADLPSICSLMADASAPMQVVDLSYNGLTLQPVRNTCPPSASARAPAAASAAASFADVEMEDNSSRASSTSACASAPAATGSRTDVSVATAAAALSSDGAETEDDARTVAHTAVMLLRCQFLNLAGNPIQGEALLEDHEWHPTDMHMREIVLPHTVKMEVRQRISQLVDRISSSAVVLILSKENMLQPVHSNHRMYKRIAKPWIGHSRRCLPLMQDVLSPLLPIASRTVVDYLPMTSESKLVPPVGPEVTEWRPFEYPVDALVAQFDMLQPFLPKKLVGDACAAFNEEPECSIGAVR